MDDNPKTATTPDEIEKAKEVNPSAATNQMADEFYCSKAAKEKNIVDCEWQPKPQGYIGTGWAELAKKWVHMRVWKNGRFELLPTVLPEGQHFERPQRPEQYPDFAPPAPTPEETPQPIVHEAEDVVMHKHRNIGDKVRGDADKLGHSGEAPGTVPLPGSTAENVQRRNIPDVAASPPGSPVPPVGTQAQSASPGQPTPPTPSNKP